MRKSTLSTLTLATLLCFSTSNYFLVSSAYAASKSAISSNLNLSNAPAPTIQAEPIPAIAPVAPTSIEIKSESTSNFAPEHNLVIDSANSANNGESEQVNPARVNPVQVNIETRSNTSLRTVPDNESTRSQPIEIVLENRSTGCTFTANSLLERDADLCNPKPAIASNQNNSTSYSSDNSANYSSGNSASYSSDNSANYSQGGEVVYAAASGDTALQVRRLTPTEIAAMSLPSNGDKQMLFPLIAPSVISSLFGSRVHPVTGQVRFHQGTDLAAAEGTPVVAAFSGRVEIAGQLGGYGLIVVISHGDTHETRYAHLSEVLVKVGQEVKQGNVIGLVGSTGLATGPHLHFELWRKMQEGLVAIDPTPQLILAMEQLQKYLAQAPKSSKKA